jgi:hypothetical protein
MPKVSSNWCPKWAPCREEKTWGAESTGDSRAGRQLTKVGEEVAGKKNLSEEVAHWRSSPTKRQ